MNIQELIKTLKQFHKEQSFAEGFSNPHSYRGDYYELGVEPTEDVTVEDMILFLEGALGKTYRGYKGGDFTMHHGTDVYLAYEGCCGSIITGVSLSYEGDEPKFRFILES